MTTIWWRPGHQTADELRDEWYQAHGWVSRPPPEALAQWAAVQEAQDDYAAQKTEDSRTEHSDQTVKEPEPTTIPVDFPPEVYLPCAEAVVDPRFAHVDMRRTLDGRTALLTYSSLDQLHRCCGDQQAWIVAPTAVLDELQNAHPFELLMLDVAIPLEQRRGQK